LAFTKNSIGQRDALRYETSLQKAIFLSQIIDYELPSNFVEQQSDILKKITKEDIKSIARKRSPVNKMVITVVGDKNLIKPGLSRLGYELIELDKEGKLLTAGDASTAPPAKAGSLSGGQPKN
jgi:zinc protease